MSKKYLYKFGISFIEVEIVEHRGNIGRNETAIVRIKTKENVEFEVPERDLIEKCVKKQTQFMNRT